MLFISALPFMASAQHSDESGNIRQLTQYQDSLNWLGKKLVNDDTEMERMNANKEFIQTLVKALKVPHSFNFSFDSFPSMQSGRLIIQWLFYIKSTFFLFLFR